LRFATNLATVAARASTASLAASAAVVAAFAASIADDETEFKILTPKSVHPFYKELRKKLTQS
jgi:hypothetical protein